MFDFCIFRLRTLQILLQSRPNTMWCSLVLRRCEFAIDFISIVLFGACCQYEIQWIHLSCTLDILRRILMNKAYALVYSDMLAITCCYYSVEHAKLKIYSDMQRTKTNSAKLFAENISMREWKSWKRI